MKTIELFKADGRTFQTYEEVEKYARENGYRITNTQCIKTKGRRVHLIDLSSR
jgi:hypothetical protein